MIYSSVDRWLFCKRAELLRPVFWFIGKFSGRYPIKVVIIVALTINVFYEIAFRLYQGLDTCSLIKSVLKRKLTFCTYGCYKSGTTLTEIHPVQNCQELGIPCEL